MPDLAHGRDLVTRLHIDIEPEVRRFDLLQLGGDVAEAAGVHYRLRGGGRTPNLKVGPDCPPEFIFYLRQLNRGELLETAGKKLPTVRDQVFVCYSHQDANWLDRLQIHLKPLERDGLIDLWSDLRLSLGDDWRRGIEAARARAKVALLLVSADFLASDFIQEAELPELLRAAEQGGCLIIPILVGPSLFFDIPDLARFQTANDNRTTLSEMKFEDSESILLRVARWLRDLFGSQGP